MPKLIREPVRDEVFRRVLEARLDGNALPSVDTLYEDLREKFGKGTVGRTTVWKLLKEARDTIKHVTPDPLWDPSPLRWAPEAYPFLLAMNLHCVQGVDRAGNDVMVVLESSQLTDREAKWCSRLYLVLKDAPIDLAFDLVRTFAQRETGAEAYEQPMRIADLIGYLQSKPWESAHAAATYETAYELGIIPKLGSSEVSEGQSRESPDWVKLEQTVEIDLGPAAATDKLSELLAHLEEALAPRDRQTADELRHIVERAQMVQQVAADRFEAMRKSRFSEHIHGQEGTGHEGTSHQEGKE